MFSVEFSNLDRTIRNRQSFIDEIEFKTIAGLKFGFVQSSVLWYALRIYQERCVKVAKASIRGWMYQNFNIIDLDYDYLDILDDFLQFSTVEKIFHTDFPFVNRLKSFMKSYNHPINKNHSRNHLDIYSEEMPQNFFPLLKQEMNHEKFFSKENKIFLNIKKKPGNKSISIKITEYFETDRIHKRSFQGKIFKEYRDSVNFKSLSEKIEENENYYIFMRSSTESRLFDNISNDVYKFLRDHLNIAEHLPPKIIPEEIDRELGKELENLTAEYSDRVTFNANNHSVVLSGNTQRIDVYFEYSRVNLRIVYEKKIDLKKNESFFDPYRILSLEGKNEDQMAVNQWLEIFKIEGNEKESLLFCYFKEKISNFFKHEWEKIFVNVNHFQPIMTIKISRKDLWRNLTEEDILRTFSPGSILMVERDIPLGLKPHYYGILLDDASVLCCSRIIDRFSSGDFFQKKSIKEFIGDNNNIIETKLKIQRYTLREVETRAKINNFSEDYAKIDKFSDYVIFYLMNGFACNLNNDDEGLIYQAGRTFIEEIFGLLQN